MFYNFYMSKFGERLKELRIENNLTILALSKDVGISDASICRWENSKTDVKGEQLNSCEIF